MMHPDQLPPPSPVIRQRLTLRPPENTKIASRMDYIRESIIKLGEELEVACHNPSRELSLALTALEEVSYWAIASIARNQGEFE